MSLLSEYQGMCQVELVGVVVELPNVNPTVLLRETHGQRRELWFPIGQADGVTLTMAWRGIATPRPLTHELMADIFVRFGLELDVVKITGQLGKTYLAELVLSQGGLRQSVSCRPTDALTLALRRLVPAPIMVAEELMQAGTLGPEPTDPMKTEWMLDVPEPEVWPPMSLLAELGAAEPGESVVPTEPADPADPVDSADPAESAEPADPAESAEPADPAESAEPADPVEPAEPGDSVEALGGLVAEPAAPFPPAEPSPPAPASDPSSATDPAPSVEAAPSVGPAHSVESLASLVAEPVTPFPLAEPPPPADSTPPSDLAESPPPVDDADQAQPVVPAESAGQ